MEIDLAKQKGMDGARWAEQYPEFRKAWQENPATISESGFTRAAVAASLAGIRAIA